MEDKQLQLLMSAPHYGCDEVGRGCLNGPVVVASCYLGEWSHPMLDDSKKITKRNREILFDEIMKNAEDVCVVAVPPDVVDEKNILQATLGGMAESWRESRKVVRRMLIDGNKVPVKSPDEDWHSVVKGDGRVPAISAASIIAKVTRDRMMDELHVLYPEMGYNKHRGYPTADHLKALDEHGLNNSYRHSFGPVKDRLPASQGTLF